jgi:hypothetical protein
MCRWYRNTPVEGNAYPVEIMGGQSFGEAHGFCIARQPRAGQSGLFGEVVVGYM